MASIRLAAVLKFAFLESKLGAALMRAFLKFLANFFKQLAMIPQT